MLYSGASNFLVGNLISKSLHGHNLIPLLIKYIKRNSSFSYLEFLNVPITCKCVLCTGTLVEKWIDKGPHTGPAVFV